MHREAHVKPQKDIHTSDYKKVLESGIEDYSQYPKQIIKKMFEKDNRKHWKFTQELFERYNELEESKNGKYSQNWRAYNKAQAKEKIALMYLLDELFGYISLPECKKVGRKPVSIKDKIFYLTIQAYNIKSSRRCISDLEIARRMGFIDKTPHFNTVLKCSKDSSITKYFKHLVTVSGIPLQQVESDFAADSTGFSTSEFGRWFDSRLGNNQEKRKFVKTHIMCGVKTNIITAVNITKGYCADSPQFVGLLNQTDRIYDIKEVSADKAYSSRDNLQAVYDLGGIPFIPFKKNVKSNTKSKNADIWRKMFVFFTKYSQQYYHHYHKRSNVESTFQMLKRKFGSHLRARSEVGQQNEILAKCLCHNLCVLIQEMMELGIDLDFKKCANIPIAYK